MWREHFYPVRKQESIIGLGAVVEDVTRLKQFEEERQRLVQTLTEERAQLARLTENLEELVEERTQQVRGLAEQLSMVEQVERQRMAQLLHDHIQQLLFGIQFRLHLLSSDLPASDASSTQENLDVLKELIMEAIALTRGLAHDLNPPVLDQPEVEDLLQGLAYHMRNLHGLETTIEVKGAPSIARQNIRLTIYNVMRELLFNVVKHAGVMAAEVSVVEEAGRLHASVSDKGSGFVLEELLADGVGRGLGLTGIQERLQWFNGEMHIDSAPGAGTKVSISLPCSPLT